MTTTTEDAKVWVRWEYEGTIYEMHLMPGSAEVQLARLHAEGVSNAHIVTDPATEIGSHLKLSAAERTVLEYAGQTNTLDGGGRVWFRPGWGKKRDQYECPLATPKRYGFQTSRKCTAAAVSLANKGLIKVPNYQRGWSVELTATGRIVLARWMAKQAKAART